MNTKKNILNLPEKLLPGDKIGIVAPSSHFNAKKFHRGIMFLESSGLNVCFSDDLFKKNGYLAGTDTHRARQVNDFFSDPTIKAVLCARGGYGSLRILSLLDYSLIQNNPKIFMGFSDATALLSVLYDRCGLVTFHGPMVTTLGHATKMTQKSIISALTKKERLIISPANAVILKKGQSTGPVLGGNLTTLCHLVGTPFEPSYKKHILFLEDTGEAAYRIDRMLIQMKLAGCFDGISGIALGTFEGCGAMDPIYQIFVDVFRDFSVPIMAGFEMGHGENNITFPIGLTATLDTERQFLVYQDS